MKRIYLAGPIAGLSYNESTNWREDVTEKLRPIECLSPLRFKPYLEGETALKDTYEYPLSTGRGIMTRDYFDCMRADIVLVNLLGASKVSIGTSMEMAWAYTLHKPVIAVMEAEGNPHDHAMIRETIGFRVTTLDDAVKVARAILLVE